MLKPRQVLDRHFGPVLRQSRAMRAAILRLAKQARRQPDSAPNAISLELQKIQPDLAEAYRQAQLGTLFEAARQVTLELPRPSEPPSKPPTPITSAIATPGSPGPRLAQSLAAANYLQTRLDFTQNEFDQLDEQAKRVGFTIARATTTEAVKRVRQALARDVQDGGTLSEFRDVIAEAVGPVLSDSQVEAIYRTQVGRAYSAGQQMVLDHPMVQDEFPYLLYSATHDSRTRPDHLAMESLGLDGTAVYRADDPIWQTHYPPWGWNCRCVVIPLSVEDAAGYGVREAKRWLRTGQPPATPEYVRVTLELPRGWVPTGRRLTSVV